jgi:glycosyl transferase, family 25
MHGVVTASAEPAGKVKLGGVNRPLDGRVFFINRDCDKERRAALQDELLKADLAAERISAVNGLDVPPSLHSYFFTQGAAPAGLRAGEVGCYASHLQAMQTIADRNLDFAVVLEDDAVLPSTFEASVAEILATLPASWDIVLLYGTPTRAFKPIATLGAKLGKVVRYSRIPSGTVAYIVNARGARKFLQSRKIAWPIDTDFRRPWAFNLEIFGVVPQLVHHSGGLTSAIQELGGRARKRRGIPLPKPGNWTGNPLHSPRGVLYNIGRLGAASWLMFMAQNFQCRLARALNLKRDIPWVNHEAAKAEPSAKGAIAR